MNSTNPSSITFDNNQNLFIFQLKSSYYAMRILPEGEVVHAGSGPAAFPVHLDQLGSYGEAYYVFDSQGRNWELLTRGDVLYHDYALAASFPEAIQVKDGDSRHTSPIHDLRLRYVRHEIVADGDPGLSPQHTSLARKSAAGRDTLVLHMKDIAYDFHVRLYYRITPEYDIIERWLELDNQTSMPVTLNKVSFASVHLPMGEYELTHAAGAWAREHVPVRRPLIQGETVLRHAGLNTGHAVNPYYLVGELGNTVEDAGTAYFGALAYSGNWSLRFDVTDTGAARIHGGYESDTYSITLTPGQSHTTPAMVCGIAGDGYGGASRRLHGFARDYILPSRPDKQNCERPVLYNSWEATYFNVTEEGQIKIAQLAADLGVELFCVDDGWFSSRRSDNSGLGDWTVSSHAFPNGLKPLIDEVKRLGMRFGLWVEPEMVNPDSDLYRAHPDWVYHHPGRPRMETRNQLILDFGRPEVVEYILGLLDALLNEYDISFFKWDMNRYVSEPGSVTGSEFSRKHVEGVYHIMDTLRRNHPEIEIESCSGGGGRVDLGILARTDQVWTSDNTDAYDRTYIQDGFSLAYPLCAMESWVTHKINHQTGRMSSLKMRFDVAMRGSLGIGTKLTELTEDELELSRKQIAFYKKIRPVIAEGDLYRLATTMDQSRFKMSVWQTVLPDQSRSVYSFVMLQQFLGHYAPFIRLKGLDPDAVYQLSDAENADIGKFHGSQLMALGIPGDQLFGGLGGAVRSRTVLLERIG